MAEKSNLNTEERFAQLGKAKQRPQTSRPKIQRVQNYIRNRELFAKHYSPKLVSIGPIHHGDTNLQLGEHYKLMWAAEYIESTAQTPQVLHKRIADKIKELKDLFTTDLFTDKKFSNYASEGFANLEEKLCWMLFVDGCALLQILEKAKLDKPDQMNVKVDQLVLVMQDVLLLENQLPYLLLKLLWKKKDDDSLKKTMINFLKCHHWATPNSDSSDQKQQGKRKQKNEGDIEGGVPQVLLVESPTHLLDLQRTIILHPETQSNEAKEEKLNQSDDSIKIRDTVTDKSNKRNRDPDATSIDVDDKTQSNEAKEEKLNQSDDSIKIRDTVTDKSNIRNRDPDATSIDVDDKTGSNEAKKKTQDQNDASNQTGDKETDRRLRNWCPLPILKDILDKMGRNEAKNQKDASKDMVTYRNIQELKAAGIRLKSSKTRRPRDVSFKHGWFAAQLTLPEIVVDDTTAATFLNMIAYEMCPDFTKDYGICSFAAFMDSLIDHPDDVKALRYKGILLNSLGSDEEVATLFNIISTDLVPDMGTYSHVRDEINKHYRNKLKTWIAQALHTHFSNPWAFIAFVAAFVALALTFVQTWFAIYPKSE